jgi:hypothetical protein
MIHYFKVAALLNPNGIRFVLCRKDKNEEWTYKDGIEREPVPPNVTIYEISDEYEKIILRTSVEDFEADGIVVSFLPTEILNQLHPKEIER